ncbi:MULTISPECIES: CidA/LrgA family protein [Pseudomonadota]|nr:hypothetical protein [Eoetvoesiella caeni]
MEQADRVGSDWLPLFAVCVVGAGVTLGATAWTLQWMLRRAGEP